MSDYWKACYRRYKGDDQFHLIILEGRLSIMTKKVKSYFVRFIACILVISLFMPIGAHAATGETISPYASAYLASYTAYICAMGDGDLEIWFEVLGTGTWADIGVLTVFLYESTDNSNFYWVKSFSFTDYPNMLWHNNYICMDHVDYEGVPGRYYKAYIEIWAGPEDGGDVRYIWTPVELCT